MLLSTILLVSATEYENQRKELESKILAAAFRQSVERGDIKGSRLAHNELVKLLSQRTQINESEKDKNGEVLSARDESSNKLDTLSDSQTAFSPQTTSIETNTETDSNSFPPQNNINSSEIVSQSDPNEIVSQSDPNKIVSQSDPNEIVSQSDPNEIVSQSDSNEIVSQSDSNEIVSPSDPNEIALQSNKNTILEIITTNFSSSKNIAPFLDDQEKTLEQDAPIPEIDSETDINFENKQSAKTNNTLLNTPKKPTQPPLPPNILNNQLLAPKNNIELDSIPNHSVDSNTQISLNENIITENEKNIKLDEALNWALNDETKQVQADGSEALLQALSWALEFEGLKHSLESPSLVEAPPIISINSLSKTSSEAIQNNTESGSSQNDEQVDTSQIEHESDLNMLALETEQIINTDNTETYANLDFEDNSHFAESWAAILAQRPKANIDSENLYEWLAAESSDPFYMIHLCYMRSVKLLLKNQLNNDKSQSLNIHDFKKQLRFMGTAYNILTDPITRTDYDLRQLGLRQPCTGNGLIIPEEAKIPDSGGKVRLSLQEVLVLTRIFDPDQILSLINASRLLPETQFWTYLSECNILSQIEIDSIKSGYHLICNGLISVVQFEHAFQLTRTHQQQILEILLNYGWAQLHELEAFANSHEQNNLPEAPRFTEVLVESPSTSTIKPLSIKSPTPAWVDWGDGNNETSMQNLMNEIDNSISELDSEIELALDQDEKEIETT